MSDRLAALLETLMNNTVLADFFAPANQALSKVRFKPAAFSSLPMDTFCLLGCLRHLHGMATSREHIQHLLHLTNGDALPVARSTYSDALSASSRCDILTQAVLQLVKLARLQLPDRLSDIADLNDGAVYAVDGSYQHESAHYRRSPPSQGGTDNPKGHMMLAFYDVRMGAPVDVCLETRNRHEMVVFKDAARKQDSLLQQRRALWVADRAFVDMPFWDAQKRRYRQTVITRLKDNLVIEERKAKTFSDSIINDGIVADETISLKASKEPWRLIRYCSPEGREFQFLINDLDLAPGVVAFLYLRRWDEEKCFDTWKNDFAAGKAWSKSITGITQQALLAVMTSLLLQMFAHHHQARWNIGDEKSLKKQEAQAMQQYTNQGKCIPWHRLYYRAVSKISRQVIRFLKYCFSKKSSQRLYEKQLKPLLMAYI